MFYAMWSWAFAPLLAGSILINFIIGKYLQHIQTYRHSLLVCGLIFNIGLLGYFKYTNFLLGSLFSYSGFDIVLPIGISFFTFQQVAYLIDTYRHEAEEYDFFKYFLFVSFFPQLIAGPIVHHKEMMGQFQHKIEKDILCDKITRGLIIFSIGLFKKVIIADYFATLATPIFTAADNQKTIGFFESWIGSLAYSFQIYFDFSAYSDMAIGLGLLFGISLPQNFNSPYKAKSIIEFWRRWHMTLSRFLRDYLYIPLGGNRLGPLRQYANILCVMLIGGLWHGAGWTFIAWGGLHGVFIICNHFSPFQINQWLSRALTLLCIVIAWVFFRVESFDGAFYLLQAMTLQTNFFVPIVWQEELAQIPFLSFTQTHLSADQFKWGILSLPLALLVCWLSPNSWQIATMNIQKPALQVTTACFCLVLMAISLWYLDRPSEFIYFQF
ncbi:MBOAT family protein [Terasakiella sp. SH-1]|uniref:MBOAT family O-acyltransferase n=1 Tax=Terasakiella sp. SH-1 TaxID=2560057 RepID=UPI00197F745B|nr:MBOAT family protein [Terasakiella sp. SH-1]